MADEFDEFDDMAQALSSSKPDIRRLRSLASRLNRRQKLEDKDQAYWDTMCPEAQEQIENTFMAGIAGTYQTALDGLGSIDVRAGIAELKGVQPRLDDIRSQEEFRQALLLNDGWLGVQFDQARRAERWLAYTTEMIKLWAAIWEGQALATSQEQRDAQLKRMLAGLYEELANVQSYLVFYAATKTQVQAVYDRVRTYLTTETRWPGS